MGPAAAEDLLEVCPRRHETASTVITTINRPTQDQFSSGDAGRHRNP